MLRGSAPFSKHLSTKKKILLDLKEKCTRYAGVPTNEADLLDRHVHRAGQSKVYHKHLQSLALFVEQTQNPSYESGCDYLTSGV